MLVPINMPVVIFYSNNENFLSFIHLFIWFHYPSLSNESKVVKIQLYLPPLMHIFDFFRLTLCVCSFKIHHLHLYFFDFLYFDLNFILRFFSFCANSSLFCSCSSTILVTSLVFVFLLCKFFFNLHCSSQILVFLSSSIYFDFTHSSVSLCLLVKFQQFFNKYSKTLIQSSMFILVND